MATFNEVSDKRQTTDAQQTHDGWSSDCHRGSGVATAALDLSQAGIPLPVETERVTLRLPKNDIATLEALVEAGEFMSISEAIRAAIRDLVRSRAPKVTEAIEARKAVFASADAAKEMDELRAAIADMQKQVNK